MALAFFLFCLLSVDARPWLFVLDCGLCYRRQRFTHATIIYGRLEQVLTIVDQQEYAPTSFKDLV